MAIKLAHLLAGLALATCGSAIAQDAEPSEAKPFTMTTVAHFSSPWAMAFLPSSGGSLTSVALLTEREGKLWLLDTVTGKRQRVSGTPKVDAAWQGGLLDVLPSPTFAADNLVYITYSAPSQYGESSLALARAKLVRGRQNQLTDFQLLWRDPAGGKGQQFGGRIAFAPDGASLFMSLGERQRFSPAQDRSQAIGKILHLTLEGQPAADNPWAGETGAATITVGDWFDSSIKAEAAVTRDFSWPGTNRTPSEIWTLGHRNPYGLAFAPDGRLWETEMGPQGGDELNLVIRGKDYGWPKASNGSNYDDSDIPDHREGDGFEPPKVSWSPSVSPGGLLIYSGDLFPEWKGDALIPALSGLAFIHVDLEGDDARKADQWDMATRLRGVDQGPRGEVYLIEDGDTGGRILKLEPSRQAKQ